MEEERDQQVGVLSHKRLSVSYPRISSIPSLKPIINSITNKYTVNEMAHKVQFARERLFDKLLTE